MLDDYRPPTWKDRLLHPLSIAAILLVVGGGGIWGYEAWTDAQRAREREAVEPLQREWEAIRAGAGPPRMAELEGVLAKAPPPVEQRCESLRSTVEVVHRPVLQALAAGERDPRPDAPYWLSSKAYGYLAGMLTPSLDEPSYLERNETVTAALARPCVVVLETDLAEDARMRDDGRFDGGGVAGWLRVVCLDEPEPRIACQTRVASQALLTVVVKQSDPRNQAGADQTAVSDASEREHWKAVELVLKAVGPGLTVLRDE
jgi:hypothetical protein